MAKKSQQNNSIKLKRGRKIKSIAELKEEIGSKCLSIRTLIDSSTLFKLKDLQSLFSTAMADELGVNHGRFADKLRNPVKFSFQELHRFAYYTGSDVEKLTKIVNVEIFNGTSYHSKLKKFKNIENIKKYTKNKISNKTGKKL